MQTHDSILNWQNTVLGAYRLTRLIGRGGMGEVWQAEDIELHRQVAVKLLPSVLRDDGDYLRAFAKEARMAASLEHPHILPVHDFGEYIIGEEVVTYLVTPLINDGSLLDRFRKSQGLFPLSLSLTYLLHAAQAIDYAHMKQLIHRDIKPANMLLQEDWLYLSDFGIARLLSTDTHRSHTSSLAGTPRYMAPEQIQGRAELASDLYSLAIIAYQLMTGHLPFNRGSFTDILRQQVQDAPPVPRAYNPNLPVAMEKAILRAMAKRPADRYASCQEFVRDLEQGWQASGGKALEATSDDPDATVIAPWNKRARPVAPDIANAETARYVDYEGFASETPAGDEIVQHSTVLDEQDLADRQAAPQQKIGRRTLLVSGIAAASVVAGGGYALKSVLSQRSKSSPGPQQLLSSAEPVLTLTGHTHAVFNALWNPVGRYLATGGCDEQIMLWDIDQLLGAAGGKRLVASHPQQAWSAPADTDYGIGPGGISWTLDGKKLAILTNAGGLNNTSVAFLDIASSTIVPDANHSPTVDLRQRWVVSSPANNALLASASDSDIYLWSFVSGKILQNQLYNIPLDPSMTNNMLAINFSLDGSQLFGLFNDNKYQHYLGIWDTKNDGAANNAIPLPLPSRPLGAVQHVSADKVIIGYNALSCVIPAPDHSSRILLKVADTGIIYDVQGKKVISQLRSNDKANGQSVQFDTMIGGLINTMYWAAQIGPLAWSPNGRYVVSSYMSNDKLYIWDLQHPLHRKDGSQAPNLSWSVQGVQATPITSIYWSPDGRYLATASVDSTVVIWKVDAA